MTALVFVILTFAAYRGARAVALDSITESFRDWVGVHGPRKLGELVTCGFCVSFWTAGLTVTLWELASDTRWLGFWEHLIVWWAIAGGAALLIAVDSYLLREAPP